MNIIESSTPLLSASAPIRNEPVQARSTARLATLLDSAAAVIDEIGYERLTTAMVAERAGASIGTVYRYFPDRIAVLQSLAARNSERLMGRVAAELVPARHASATDALLAVLDAMTELFRTEPGYRSVRVGDVLDLLPPTTESTANAAMADVVADALVARAFARDGRGDAALLAEAARAVRAVVAGRL